jgi:hypothetical protein
MSDERVESLILGNDDATRRRMTPKLFSEIVSTPK